jgi:hypothetical protein
MGPPMKTHKIFISNNRIIYKNFISNGAFGEFQQNFISNRALAEKPQKFHLKQGPQ